MYKVILFLFCLIPSLCLAENYPVQEVTAEGVGSNEREAVEDALRNAIEESIGLYVDSETKLKNDQLISDNLLTSSKGYIDKYRLLSIKSDSGLTKVKIKALVKIQDVKMKLTGLNISILSADDSANTFARLSTKLKRSQNAEKILKKEFKNFFQTENLLDMLTVRLVDYKIFEEELQQDNTVPYEVSFVIAVNMDNYAVKAKELTQALENLGGKLVRTLPVELKTKRHKGAIIRKDEFTKFKKRYRNKLKKKKIPCFGVVRSEGHNLVLNHYCFPVEWKNIYPWNRKKVEGCRHCGMRIQLEDVELALQFTSNGSIIHEVTPRFNSMRDLHTAPLAVFKFHWPNIGSQNMLTSNWGGFWENTASHNIGPFIDSRSHLVTEISLHYKGMINVDLLYDIQKVELKLRKKSK